MPSTIRLAICTLLTFSTLLALLPISPASGQTTITAITASGSEKGNPPIHAIDTDPKTRWAQLGKGQWIQLQFSQPTDLESIDIAFYRGTRTYKVDLLFSHDGKKWTAPISLTSNGKGDDVQTFAFERTKCQHIRLVNLGSDANDWINVSTLRFKGIAIAKEILAKAAAPAGPTSETGDGITVSEFGGVGSVGSPVGISVDNHGRVFVTETRRRKRAAPDVRSLTPFMLDGLASQSVEDKSAAIRRHRQDWETLDQFKEVIWQLTDEDGDGKFDKRVAFYEGLNEDVSGVAGGVLCVNDDVYVTCIPSFYRLRDKNKDGQAEEIAELARGMGIHIGYAGHDMHGPTLGVDGRIYWSMGDKGVRVIRKEDGRDFFYPGHGAVFRIEQDGTGFEVFAAGLRNPQELAFDDFGNLFTADNDGDMGDSERLHFLVKGIDVGWRAFYQYRGKNYNPWMKDRLWELKNDSHPAYLSPPLEYTASGPIGFVFNPGTALNEKYRNYFFLASSNKSTAAFQLEANGAGFKRINKHIILSNTFATGLSFGPDGALYAADWGNNGWQPHNKGRVLKLETPAAVENPLRKETQRLLSAPLNNHSPSELARLLQHRDQRVRLKAQFELVKRSETNELTRVCSGSTDDPMSVLARVHAIWGIGQLGRKNSDAVQPLVSLLADADSEIRAQAAKMIGEARYDKAADAVAKLLADKEPRVRMMAGIALRDIAKPEHRLQVATMLEDNNDEDDFLRHAGIMALSGIAKTAPNELLALTAHPSVNVRTAAVVALRRANHPETWRFLNDRDPRVSAEAARAIHDDLSIELALPALAGRLDLPVGDNEPLGRRVISANRRVGDAKAAIRLAEFATREDQNETLRIEAVETLASWGQPLGLDRVQGYPRNQPPNEIKFAHAALDLTLGALLSSKSNGVQQATTKAIAALKYGNAIERVTQLAFDQSQTPGIRGSSLEAMFALKADRLDEALQLANKSRHRVVRTTALKIKSLHAPNDASTFAAVEKAISSAELEERQNAYQVLGNLNTSSSNSFLENTMKRFATVDKNVQLDVYLAAEQSPSTEVRTLANSIKKQLESKPLELFALSRDGGNVANGKSIFETSAVAQCARCHRVGGAQTTVGPDLLKIATKRDRDYLLRAVVRPSVDMDAKYRPQQFILLNGKSVSGTILSESDKEFVVAESADKTTRIAKDNIDERIEQKVSIMPDMTKTLSPRQIRDLVAYLHSLK
jgi:putative membrane-bound dehydrogenase-like protein